MFQASRSMARAGITTIFGLTFLFLASARPVPGQEGGEPGQLRGIVFDSTTMRELADAMVVVLGTSVRGATDEAGRFRLEGIPPGSRSVSFVHPRLQELGVNAPVHEVDFRRGVTSEVLLALPSEETLLEVWCLLEARGPDIARLAGVVRDTLTGVVIPRATVQIQRLDPVSGNVVGSPMLKKADEAGYYRLCDAPVGPVVVQPRFGLSSGIRERLELDPDRPSLQDLRVILSSIGRLQGTVTDYQTGEPVAGASVGLPGTEHGVTTDETGRFVLDSIPPGMQGVRTEFVGYAPRVDSVTIFSSEVVQVDIKLTTEAIAIEGMVVTARGRRGEELADVGRRRDFMARTEIERVLPRVRAMQDLIEEARFPALDVKEVNMADAAGGRVFGLCIEAVRMQRKADMCTMVMVVLDGVPLPNPGERLQALPPEMVQTIEYLSPIEATTRYGTGGASGALLITTRR